MANKIKCTCGHSWNKSDSSKKDATVCHICGKDTTMQMGGFVYPVNYVPQKNGGWLDAYEDDVPEAQNGIEGTMGGLTDKGFNYNGAWGGPSMQMGGSMPGAVGFTYARTQGAAPSNGPYAKKTKASAQKGIAVSDNTRTKPVIVDKPMNRESVRSTEKQSYRMSPQEALLNKLKGVKLKESQDRLDKTAEKITAVGSLSPNPFISVPSAIGNFALGASELDLLGLFGSTPSSLNKFKQIGRRAPFFKAIGVADALSDIFEFTPSEDLPKRQNGGEMKFYQEGLDWKPRNISRDGSEIPQAQLGLHMLTPDYNQVGENIMEMLSFPQKALTKLISGKYQTPSEAMGIKNKVGAIAIDILLDPANLVGGTGAAKIAKGVKAAKAAKAANSVAKKVKPNFKSEIDWAKWNKEIPENTQLMNEYNAIEQSTKKAGTWMKNPDGSTFKGTPEQFVQQNSSNFKKAFPEGFISGYRGSQSFDPTLSKSLRGNENNNILFGATEKETAEHYATNSGFNLDHLFKNLNKKPDFFHPDIHKPNTYTGYVDDANPGMYEYAVNKNLPTITAEGSGKSWRNVKNNEVLKWLEKNNPENKNIRIGESAEPNLVKTDDVASYMVDKQIPIGISKNTVDSYKGNATDILMSNSKLARPKSLRYNNGMFDMINPNIYKSILPYALPTAIGAGALQQKKQGGDIKKDDNGYWNPENWGKPVEIGSNNITMQGVYEPLLGISDTGDTQLMMPGEDYTFDGESVTEYPVAQNGKKVKIPMSDFKKMGSNYVDSLNTYDYTQALWEALNKGNSSEVDQTILRNKNLINNTSNVKPTSYDNVTVGGKNYRIPSYEYPKMDPWENYEPVKGFWDNVDSKLSSISNTIGKTAIGKSMQKIDNKIDEGVKKVWRKFVDNDKEDNVQNQGATLSSSVKKQSGPPKQSPPQSTKPKLENDSYIKKYSPIYLDNPKDPRIGQYTEKGNQYLYKKPKQSVEYKKPKSKQEVVKKQEPTQPPVKKTEQPKPIERKQNVYEGSPVYSPGAGIGMGSALIGFLGQQGDTTYIKPEDYERFAVPKYGKEFIESKKKKKNGGWLDKYN